MVSHRRWSDGRGASRARATLLVLSELTHRSATEGAVQCVRPPSVVPVPVPSRSRCSPWRSACWPSPRRRFASSSPQPAAASPSATEPPPRARSSPAAGRRLAAVSAAAVAAVARSRRRSPASSPRATVVFGDTVDGHAASLDPAGRGPGGRRHARRRRGRHARLTDATGAYEVTVHAASQRRRGRHARTPIPPSRAAPQALSVKPKVSVSHGTLVPFLPSRFVVKVTPSAYDGVVVVKVVHRGVTVGSYRARVKDGRAVLQIPLRGVDGFTLDVTLPAGGRPRRPLAPDQGRRSGQDALRRLQRPLRQGHADRPAAAEVPRPRRGLQRSPRRSRTR